ncbi:MAG: hypothetical protein HW421_3691 [Ignavibacteria bacterium]|nr:hypothetical protein [Ignavibacteria bacterium]
MFNIETLEIIEGDIPKRAIKLILEWATQYQNELLNIWNTQEFKKLPRLE